MKLTKIYVGSNNTTKELEITKIHEVCGWYLEGFTIIQAQGYWKGEKENSAIIEYYGDRNNEDLFSALKGELSQESLLVAVFITETNFI